MKDGLTETYKDDGSLVLRWTSEQLWVFEMNITFEPADDDHDDRLMFRLIMPDNMWFSLGFGTDMFDTDMIAWHAKGKSNSYVGDYFSVKKDTPAADDSNDIEQRLVMALPKNPREENDYNKVAFVCYRNIDTGDSAQDYLIKLREETDMVYAWRLRDSRWKYHA